MPVILRYDLDWRRQGERISSSLASTTDLRYHSMVVRSLGLGTLFVLNTPWAGANELSL